MKIKHERVQKFIDKYLWVTGEREILFIPFMETDHLKNTVRLLNSSFRISRTAEIKKVTMEDELSRRLAKSARERAEKRDLEEAISQLLPYGLKFESVEGSYVKVTVRFGVGEHDFIGETLLDALRLAFDYARGRVQD